MALYGVDLLEEEMYPAIWRMLRRYYSYGCLLKKPYVCRPYATTDNIPDVVYFRAYNAIHVFEAKRFRRYLFDAIAQLGKYRGNWKYVVLPDGEYLQDQAFVDDMIAGRYGLVLVSRRGQHLYAEFEMNSPCYPGDFSGYYRDYV